MSEVSEKLFYKQKNGYDLMTVAERKKMESYCKGYMKFLDASRTERECVVNIIAEAEANGFIEYKRGMTLNPGMKIYLNNRGKALFLAVIGKQPLEEGCFIAGAHIDSPRLDLKQLPLFESDELCYFKTHYYGGIKKYQWLTVPLELHGTVALKNGGNVDICVGRNPGDPKFVISDLLPHLAQDQMQKALKDAIPAESLNILIGSTPYNGEEKDRVKLAVMSILNEEYGITEEDFLSAELCAVPSYDVAEIGFDRSLIGAYGHDDRVCAYAEYKALFDVKNPEKTCVCILADKEETGSDGVSGMQSMAFDWFMDDLCRESGAVPGHCYGNSFCISADVCNAFDPNFPEVSEKRNEAKLNYGVGICKFTGARGKSGTSDASAEVVARLRAMFEKNKVVWQMAELGKVDQGGGGTIAKYMANRNIDTIDAGVPVMSMHAPFETVSKFDCYMTYKAVLAMYSEK